MAIIRPFNALRPAKEVVNLVASVPYDVVNREEAFELVKENRLNFLRVTRSEVELDPGINPYDQSVYEKAKSNLDRLTNEAPLIQDGEPKFYIYKLVMDGQSQAGIAATFAVDDYDNNVILKHEKTRKVKEDDRTNHIVTTLAQTGAVFLTYKAVDEIDALVEKTMTETEPLYDFTSPDGVQHTVWEIPSDYKDILIFEIEKVQNLYIADGHHRAASAGRSQKVMKQKSANHTGNEEYNYFMAVLFPGNQLNILPYNRVVLNLNNLKSEEFMEKISENFTVSETQNPSPESAKSFCMYFENKWYLLKPNENVTEVDDSIGENLDVSILQNFLLSPVLGIGDPRTDTNIDFIGGIRGTEELEKLVNSGKAKVAFSMYPVSVDDLMKISDAGEVMPPKSTWFEPKLRDGLLVHKI